MLVVSDSGLRSTSYGLRPAQGLAEWFATLDGVEGFLRGLATSTQHPRGGADG